MTAALPIDIVREALGAPLSPVEGALRKAVTRLEARISTGRSVSAVPAPFAQYRDNPVGFFREVLGVEPWGRHAGLPADEASQIDILEAVRDNPLTAVRSGHKIGKSASAAGLGLWWVLTRVGGKTIITAPSEGQVKDLVWQDVSLLHAGHHPGQAGKTLPRLPGTVNLDPATGYRLGPNWGIYGKVANTKERMAGPAGADVLWIVDEASGYPEDLFEAIFGSMAGSVHCVMFGNPTRTSGTFFDAFHDKREAWKGLHTSSLSTPNFHGEKIPGLADPHWHETVAKVLWGGPGSPLYDIRVLGNFPGQASKAIVGLALLEAARARWAETPPEGRLEIGVDVARELDGDETITAARRGRKVIDLRPVPLDPRLVNASPPIPLGHQAALGVVRVARELCARDAAGRPIERPRIKVDAIGNGTACLDYLLAHHAQEFEIVAVVVSKSADKTLMLAPGRSAYDHYLNLRAQVVFGVKLWLESGGAVPRDEKLAAELVAPTWHDAAGGKLAVEGKDEIKKRLKRSPDRADALALSVYKPPRTMPVYRSAVLPHA